MDWPNSNRKPSFLWQGLLILLPVAILAAVGLAALRQDRLIAEGEARAKAADAADALLPLLPQAFDCRDILTPPGLRNLPAEVENFQRSPTVNPAEDPVFSYAQGARGGPVQIVLTGPAGELIYPPPALLVPAPQPLNPAVLSATQSNLWTQALDSEYIRRQATSTAAAFDRFLDTSPPDAFAALACYDGGIAWRESGETAKALQRFERAMRQYGQLASESGIPYRQLGLLQCAGDPSFAALTNADWTALCREAVTHPTILSERLLSLALEHAAESRRQQIRDWTAVWNSHQASREVYEQSRRLLDEQRQHDNALPNAQRPAGGFNWLGDGAWFAFTGAAESAGNASNQLIVAQSAGELRRRTLEVIGGRGGPDHFALPGFLGVEVELAGRKLLNSTNAGPLLLSRDTTVGAGGARPVLLKLDVFLADPAAFYARQRQRALTFSLLIATAAAAAFAGFFAARRAFRRQLHLSEMKSNFVSSVSHELRAPIASVRLMAEGLERGKIQDPQKQNEYFRFIVQECRRLSSLIENVLDFSRIEQGRRQYECEPSDVVALAQETVKLMQTPAAARQIHIAFQMAGEPFPADLDGRAVQQALVNLIDNAIKHSPMKSTVSVGLDFDPSPYAPSVRLWVEDHGEGIPAAEHEKIFERFYRLGSELRRETQGVGIGLSLVKHIVEAHGGSVLVRSAPGQGSRFTIELPARQNTSCATSRM